MRKIKIARRGVLNWVFLLATVVLGANALLLIHSRFKAQEVRRGGPIPYTVILRETVYGPNGEASIAAEETYAIRSDGSYSKKLTHKKQAGDKLLDQDSARTMFLASGIEVEINDFADTKSTTASNVNLAKLQRDPGSKCISTFAGTPGHSTIPEYINGEEIVSGYRTVKITSADNLTWWFALDHGCATVKVRADWGSKGYSEKTLINLIPGEPDAALFNVPAWAKEVAPSERILGSGKDASRHGPRYAETLRKLDERYNANRPKN